ncbi:MAG: hypothetical protein Fur0018_00800 [Anaerolineales bacterium]
MLLPAPTYLPSRRANTIQVMKMAHALCALGEAVHLTIPDPYHQPPPDWESIAHQYGLAHRFKMTWLPVQARWRSHDYAWQVMRLAQREHVDWVYTRHPQAAALCSLVGISTILEVHDLPQGYFGPLWFRTFLAGSGARALAVITRALKDALPIQRWQKSTIILPDGVDLARFSDLPSPPAARAALNLPQGFTAGYTGHLYAGRGVEMILQLARRLPEMNFLLAGGNPEDVAHLKAQTAGLENIIFTGFIPNADLPRYQAACDVLMMPYQLQVSASSGGDIGRFLSPMKVFEYMACGRVILSSDLPVLREVLHAGNALLLPPQDVDAWEHTLRAVQQTPRAYTALCRQARQDAARYTWESRAYRLRAYAGTVSGDLP